MKKHNSKLFFGLGIGLISNLLVAFPLLAQQFTVSPLVTIVEAKSGQARGTISVINQAKDPLRMRVYTESFTYDKQKGFTFTAKDERSAAPYLQFSPREIEIPPGVTRNIRVAVSLPPSLPNQEYRVAVFLEDLKERTIKPNANNNVLLIKARVASVFFFSKGNSTANIQARSTSWNADNKKVSILLENQGTKSAYPDIDWRIDRNGKEIATDSIRGVIVQSQNSREVEVNFNYKLLKLTSGEYNLSGIVRVQYQKPAPFNLKFIVP
jgi:P pilus assembly chaperone PapD